MRKFYNYAHVPLLLIFIVSAIRYFSFTAEDAYITYRYAENYVNSGALIFNQGEPINAMTSPLHAMLSATLFALTGRTVLSNKILALLLVLFSATLVWRRYRGQPHWQLLALGLIILPPSVLLWAVGGLETPLLLFLVTSSVVMASTAPPFPLGRLVVIFFLATLAFLTRYDSVLFFLPLMAHCAWNARTARHVAAALVPFAILPGLWLMASVLYYGDPLPTSFYVKTPHGGAEHLLYNGLYIGSYLLYLGIFPTLALALILLPSKRNAPRFFLSHLRTGWWLYGGIALQLLYGLMIATHHMMFSFRFFIPYLPAAVILVVDLARSACETKDTTPPAGRTAMWVALFVICLTLFQTYQIAYTYHRSVNGIVSIGEYRSLGVRDYIQFMETLQQAAYDVERHWNQTEGEQNRNPRIITFAAGVLPYTVRESYIYEQLVSYRHCLQRHNQALHADYIHLMAPRHGSVDQQLPMPESHYFLISSYELPFDGSRQRFLVYFNPQPEPHNLPARIDGACR